MLDFILYCLKCLGMTISVGFGGTPEGSNFKTCIIGIATLIVLIIIGILIVLGILYIISKIKSK